MRIRSLAITASSRRDIANALERGTFVVVSGPEVIGLNESDSTSRTGAELQLTANLAHRIQRPDLPKMGGLRFGSPEKLTPEVHLLIPPDRFDVARHFMRRIDPEESLESIIGITDAARTRSNYHQTLAATHLTCASVLVQPDVAIDFPDVLTSISASLATPAPLRDIG